MKRCVQNAITSVEDLSLERHQINHVWFHKSGKYVVLMPVTRLRNALFEVPNVGRD